MGVPLEAVPATTVKAPGMLFAVAVTAATPSALVTATGLESVALAPVVGAVKKIGTPAAGRPAVSLNVTSRDAGNAAFTEVACGVPPVGVRPAILVLVSEKLAVRPAAVAVTV